MEKPLDKWLDGYFQQRPQLKRPEKNVFGEYEIDPVTRAPFEAMARDLVTLQEQLTLCRHLNAQSVRPSWNLPHWLRRFLNHFVGQGLPKWRYLGSNTHAYIKHSEQRVNLRGTFYSPKHGEYLYWVDVDPECPVALIPETFLVQSNDEND